MIWAKVSSTEAVRVVSTRNMELFKCLTLRSTILEELWKVGWCLFWSQTSQRISVWSIISGTFDFCQCMTFRWMICTVTQSWGFELSPVYVGAILMALVTSRDLGNRHDRFRSIRIDRDLFWICFKRIWAQVEVQSVKLWALNLKVQLQFTWTLYWYVEILMKISKLASKLRKKSWNCMEYGKSNFPDLAGKIWPEFWVVCFEVWKLCWRLLFTSVRSYLLCSDELICGYPSFDNKGYRKERSMGRCNLGLWSSGHWQVI